MRGKHGVNAAIDETEHIIVRDFLAKWNAARAKNAALVVQRDARAELHIFWFLHLIFEKTRGRRPVIDAEFLQTAFASLIANGTIEWMIDKQKLHHPALAFLDQRRICPYAHTVGDILGAGDLGTRHPIDHWFAVGAELRFAIRAHFRHADLDQ